MDRIPVNIWDDYWDDDSGKPQVTSAYVEDHGIPDGTKRLMIGVVIGKLRELDLQGVEFEPKGDEIEFRGLRHGRRERLVEELNAARLSFEGVPFDFYSES